MFKTKSYIVIVMISGFWFFWNHYVFLFMLVCCVQFCFPRLVIPDLFLFSCLHFLNYLPVYLLSLSSTTLCHVLSSRSVFLEFHVFAASSLFEFVNYWALGRQYNCLLVYSLSLISATVSHTTCHTAVWQLFIRRVTEFTSLHSSLSQHSEINQA